MKPTELDHLSTKCAMKVSINNEQKSNGGRKTVSSGSPGLQNPAGEIGSEKAYKLFQVF